MSYNPHWHANGFGLVRVRSPLLTESLRFLFHGLLRCFSSPGALLTPYFIQEWIPQHYSWWVSPFGNLRIISFVLIPGAYRRLHVLLRHYVPRHSPHTLCSFKKKRRSSLSVFYAQSTDHYAAVKMLSGPQAASGHFVHWQGETIPARRAGVKQSLHSFGKPGLGAQGHRRPKRPEGKFEPTNPPIDT